MRHLRALAALLVLLFALPGSVRADTGWSLEAGGVLRPPPPPPARAAAIQAASPGDPGGVVGPAAPVAAILAPAGSGAPDARRPRAGQPAPRFVHVRTVRASHSRFQATQRRFLSYAPVLVRAAVGIVGFHASPPPPPPPPPSRA